ncbi:hypothetical protein [Burkholderia phage FLC9]|nr:hypothetical protein [Burkholderia phage FLC9]
MIAVTQEDAQRIKQWIVHAAKVRAKDIGKDKFTHRQYRDQITREYYGVKLYRELCSNLKEGFCPPRIKTSKTGGVYDLRSVQGETHSYQDILNLLGPFCKNEQTQDKLVRKMDEVGERQFEGMAHLRARTAAWRIGRDVFDRVFVILFDFPAGQRVTREHRPCARLNLDTTESGVIRGLEIARS